MQGALAPLFASAALFGGYVLIKYLPDINLQTFLNSYFWLVGSIAITTTLVPTLRQLVSTHTHQSIAQLQLQLHING